MEDESLGTDVTLLASLLLSSLLLLIPLVRAGVLTGRLASDPIGYCSESPDGFKTPEAQKASSSMALFARRSASVFCLRGM